MMTYDLAAQTARTIIDTRLRELLEYCGWSISDAERDAISNAAGWILKDIDDRVLQCGVGPMGLLVNPGAFDECMTATEVCKRIGNRQVRRLFEDTRDAMPEMIKAAIRRVKDDIVADLGQSIFVHGVEWDGNR